MEIERDLNLRGWTIRDKKEPVAVIDGKSVYEVSFSDKTMRTISSYLQSTGGFATSFVSPSKELKM